jgi:hypothetical protein
LDFKSKGNFVLQTGSCSFLYLHIGPWGKLFILLLSSLILALTFFLFPNRQHSSISHPIDPISLPSTGTGAGGAHGGGCGRLGRAVPSGWSGGRSWHWSVRQRAARTARRRAQAGAVGAGAGAQPLCRWPRRSERCTRRRQGAGARQRRNGRGGCWRRGWRRAREWFGRGGATACAGAGGAGRGPSGVNGRQADGVSRGRSWTGMCTSARAARRGPRVR